MRKVKKAKWLIIMMAAAMLVSLVPALAGAVNDDVKFYEPGGMTLYAGQDIEVGTVTVTNDKDYIYVKYALNQDAVEESWLIYETHLAVAPVVAGKSVYAVFSPLKWVNRSGNPSPGQFPYKQSFADGVKEWTKKIKIPAGWSGCLYIAAHAVIKKIDCQTVSSVIQPELTWCRSSEKEVASFPGYGAGWDPETKGFTIPLTEELVWDGGTDAQYFKGYSTRSDVNWASWVYAASDPRGGSYVDKSDLRRFQTTFALSGEVANNITKATLKAPGYEDKDVIPINDTVYIFLNKELSFWGGTRVSGTGAPGALTTFQDISGIPGIWISNKAEQGILDITDGWYIPGKFPDLDVAKFKAGENCLDVFTEENQEGGGMAELVLTLEYEEYKTYKETAWGQGTRFVERGNWATYFCYNLCECEPEPVLVDTVQVTPFGTAANTPTPTYSNITLESGKGYQLVASGTYRFANWGEYGIADAAWNYRRAANAPGGVAGWYQQESQALQVWIGGAPVSWQPAAYNPEHIYTLDVTGKGGQLMFTIMDDQYADNSGLITVKIYERP